MDFSTLFAVLSLVLGTVSAAAKPPVRHRFPCDQVNYKNGVCGSDKQDWNPDSQEWEEVFNGMDGFHHSHLI